MSKDNTTELPENGDQILVDVGNKVRVGKIVLVDGTKDPWTATVELPDHSEVDVPLSETEIVNKKNRLHRQNGNKWHLAKS